MVELTQARTLVEIARVRELFQEYAASLNFSLCFQDFEQELMSLPGDYSPPDGRLLLAWDKGHVIGCVALRRIAADACEMKRLYVRPQQRGLGIGRQLAQAIVAEARSIGYRRMCLDTVPATMPLAVKLYRALGFRESKPYCENPLDGAMFMELNFNERRTR